MKVTTKLFLMIAASALTTSGFATLLHAQKREPWQSKVAQLLPLLGHRNWILIVDSAYPLQVSPGVVTLETNDAQLDVVRQVLDQIGHSNHVRANVLMDAELPFVKEQDAPGVSAYRQAIHKLFAKQRIQTLPHEQIISEVEQAGKSFQVLVLKTTMTIPYTSVFLQLDCKYWPQDAEQRLRDAMQKPKQK